MMHQHTSVSVMAETSEEGRVNVLSHFCSDSEKRTIWLNFLCQHWSRIVSVG